MAEAQLLEVSAELGAPWRGVGWAMAMPWPCHGHLRMPRRPGRGPWSSTRV